MRTAVKWTAIGAVLLFGALQLVPYGREHTNPPVQEDPAWASDRTEALARAACADCHSNRTEWPWYSHIAPFSWLTQRDVEQGRAAWNWSEGSGDADEAAEVTADGEMPPRRYTLAHPDAKLSARERADLVAGLAATFGDDRE